MKRPRNGSTMKQRAYAMHVLRPAGKRTKKEAALAAGYAPSVATSIVSKIESTEGFANAMRDLAAESGNVVLQIMHTLKHKDMAKEDFKTLIDAASTMASVWEKLNVKPLQKEQPEKSNNLKVIFQNHAQNQTIKAVPDQAETIQAQPVGDQDQEQTEGATE